MMPVKFSFSEVTVFTLRLLTPVKILFLATFKHPVKMTFFTTGLFVSGSFCESFKKPRKDDIKVNDIITFNVEEETITHRVMSIDNINNEIIYTTKGDSNKVTDIEKVEQRQIEGKYIGKIPKAGKILTLLKNKIVFGLTIIILIICFSCGNE